MVAGQAVHRHAQCFQRLTHARIGFRLVADQITGGQDEIGPGMVLLNVGEHGTESGVHIHAPDPAAGGVLEMQVTDLDDP